MGRATSTDFYVFIGNPAMLALLACALCTQVPVGQPPRLRTILPNGAVVLVERIPSAKSLSVALFVSSRTSPETPTTHGLRHLLEHLAAKGRHGDLDRRLESQGGFLYARTLRDATEFEVSVPKDKLGLAVDVLTEIEQLGPLEDGTIEREVQIIRQEGIVKDRATRLSEAAWQAAYGVQGLSPFGDLDVLASAKPGDVEKLHHSLFVGENMAIVVAGDVDLDEATALAKKALAAVPKSSATPFKSRPGNPGRAESSGYGEARAAIVPAFDEPRTAASLAAALALASGIEGTFVTYTPSVNNGLVVLGRTDENTGLGSWVDSAKGETLFALGRTMARRWVQNQLGDPSSVSSFRGLLMIQRASARPETMLENLDRMTVEQFRAAMDGFRDPGGVVVTGS